MPIKGLTDKDQIQFGAGLPRIATIYKGDEKPKEGNRPGKDLEYFRIEFEPEFENLRPEWEDLYGEEPKEFPEVYLAQGTVEEAFATWKEEWNASQTLIHRCDGENQVSAFITSGPDTGYRTTAKIACATSCQCKPVGRLNLIFSDFIQITGVLGYITIATHSVHDIIGLHRALTDYYKIRTRTGNDLTGMPFVFGRAKREISAPKSDGKGGRTAQRMKVSKSLLYIRPTAEFTNAVILPALATPQIAALPAPAQPAPVVTELRLADGLKNGNERRVTADRPLMVQSEQPGKKIELGEDGKLIVITPEEAPETKPEETPAVVVESTVTNVITMPETEPDILPTTPNLQPATVTKVSVKPTGEGKRKELILTMSDPQIGFVRAYSRKLFIDAGWIDDSQWASEGMIELTPPIPVMLKRDAKTGRYWELAEVVKPVNPFLEKAAS